MEENSQLDEMRASIGAARARVSSRRSGLQSIAPDEPAKPEPEPIAEPRPSLLERLRARMSS